MAEAGFAAPRRTPVTAVRELHGPAALWDRTALQGVPEALDILPMGEAVELLDAAAPASVGRSACSKGFPADVLEPSVPLRPTLNAPARRREEPALHPQRPAAPSDPVSDDRDPVSSRRSLGCPVSDARCAPGTCRVDGRVTAYPAHDLRTDRDRRRRTGTRCPGVWSWAEHLLRTTCKRRQSNYASNTVLGDRLIDQEPRAFFSRITRWMSDLRAGSRRT